MSRVYFSVFVNSLSSRKLKYNGKMKGEMKISECFLSPNIRHKIKIIFEEDVSKYEN